MRRNVNNDVSKDSTIEKLEFVIVDQSFLHTTHFLKQSNAKGNMGEATFLY